MFGGSRRSTAESVIAVPRVSCDCWRPLRASKGRGTGLGVERMRAANQSGAAMRYERYLRDHSGDPGLAAIVFIDSDPIGA